MSAKGATPTGIEFIPVSLSANPSVIGDGATPTDVDVEAISASTGATPSALATAALVITYVGVNIANVTENGDNGAETTNTISFASGNSQPGTALQFGPGDRHSTRSLKILLLDTTKPGSLVMIASGDAVAKTFTISVNVSPKTVTKKK